MNSVFMFLFCFVEIDCIINLRPLFSLLCFDFFSFVRLFVRSFFLSFNLTMFYTSVGSVFRMLCDLHIHRVYIHDDLGLPIGVVTFKDLLAYLLSKVRHSSMDWSDLPATTK